MNTLSFLDGVQPIKLWQHQNNTTAIIPSALIRRFRHRLYSQVVDTAVPVNFSHWYFTDPTGSTRPLPGDEINELDGTVWTILEVNQSPLTGIWQAVCETFAFAEPAESVDHFRQSSIVASLPVRVGALTMTLEPEVAERLTFYLPPSSSMGLIDVEPNDFFQRSDGTQWKIVRVERPMYRARWTAVVTTRLVGT